MRSVLLLVFLTIAGTSFGLSLYKDRGPWYSFGIYPGTLWCGNGNIANDTESVGHFSGPDRCCRQHDACPKKINGMSTRYGLYNDGMITASLCSCDQEFRTCLMLDGSPDAMLVGDVFFNQLKIRCITLKREKRCRKWTWWGRCQKETKRRRLVAEFNNSPKFP